MWIWCLVMHMYYAPISAAPPRHRPRVISLVHDPFECFPPPTRTRARRTNVHLHMLADAGHWVHVDDLDGMLRLMGPTFAPPEPEQRREAPQ